MCGFVLLAEILSCCLGYMTGCNFMPRLIKRAEQLQLQYYTTHYHLSSFNRRCWLHDGNCFYNFVFSWQALHTIAVLSFSHQNIWFCQAGRDLSQSQQQLPDFFCLSKNHCKYLICNVSISLDKQLTSHKGCEQNILFCWEFVA